MLNEIIKPFPSTKTPWKNEAIQDVMFAPDSTWRPPATVISPCKTIAVDMETRDPQLTTKGPGFKYGEGRAIGIAFASEEGPMYLPFGHLGGDNLDEKLCLRIAQNLIDCADEIYMANATYDLGWMDAWGLRIPKARIRDVQVAEALLDEEKLTYSLDSLSLAYLKRSKDEEALREAANAYGVNPKKDLWKLPARYVGRYAEIDALNTLEVGLAQKPALYEQDLWSLWDLECDITKICYKMTKKGVPVDLDRADELNNDLIKREKELKSKFTFDIWSGPQIGQWMEGRGLQVPKTDKGNYSVTRSFLENSKNPELLHLAELRNLNRLRKVFIEDGILNGHYRGYVHASFKQTASDEGGTRSGRFSCTQPNLQQVPKRSEIGKLIRTLYVAEPGSLWAKADYSSQEPRFQVHYALLLGLPGALEAKEAFVQGIKLYTFLEKLTGLPYDTCKMLVLGIGYGMGVEKMAETLSMSTTRCTQVRNQFKEKAPFIPMLFERCMSKAEKKGFIKTILGRRARFNWWVPGRDAKPVKGYNKAVALHETKNLQRAFLSKAMNRLIQGSAADQTKKAMVDCDNAGIDLRLPVHDELNSMVSSEKEAKTQCVIMENTIQLKIPSVADLDLGKGWC
jgi:DNA polymerase I-like protein with 3'-5' exonuclease and polymerase domains